MIEFNFSIDENGQINVCYEDLRGKKKREYKGKSANRHLDDYCLVDLETTGVFIGSSEIIEISAVKVRKNEVVGEFSTLINPQCHIPEEATEVNHITDEMVQDAPLLFDVIDQFLLFVGDDVIVGYNNASFDMNLIYDSVQEIKALSFSNDYIDLLHVSRRMLEGLENYKLETISKHYGLDIAGEHRALKDCYLTKACYDKIFEEFGDVAFQNRGRSASGKSIQYSSETLVLQELQGLLKGILEDGKVTLEEVELLRFWIEEHRDLSGHYPFDRTFNALDDVLEDGVITQEELKELKEIFSEVVDPVKCNCCHDEIISLQNKHVCITGEFAYGARGDVECLITDAGGIVDKGVKKTTDYLVVGYHGSDAWKTGNYGGKIQKAMEYNSKGADIKIVEEKPFVSRIQYLIDHPEENEKIHDSDMPETNDSDNWKASIQSMLYEIVTTNELPEQSLYLLANRGRDSEIITSYSICIYEPDYPLIPNAKKDQTRNSIVLNIKEAKGKLELLVGTTVFGDLDEPDCADIKILKSDRANVHVLLSKSADSLIPYIKKITEYALANYKSKAASFGCCSSFIECSDAKRCVHENKLYSKACKYRMHLDAGHIFYGKNKNID